MRLWTVGMAMLTLVGEVHAQAGSCAMEARDRSWIEHALTVSDYMRTQRLKLTIESHPTIVVFDSRCRFEGRAGTHVEWKGTLHAGTVHLPDGDSVPAKVTSFTARNDKTGEVFFVMALPSIWEAAKAIAPTDSNGATAVFLHEFMHVTQLPILQPLFDSTRARFGPQKGLNDDRIQALYKSDPAYVAVFEKERDLLFAAADEPDSAKARKLARDAFALMKARQDRWFTGDAAVWKSYDDLFLTMEGIGQWLAYAWLADPAGGRMSAMDARNKMRGRKTWWSQDEGLGLLLVIDRFLPSWPVQAFGTHPVLAAELLGQVASEHP